MPTVLARQGWALPLVPDSSPAQKLAALINSFIPLLGSSQAEPCPRLSHWPDGLLLSFYRDHNFFSSQAGKLGIPLSPCNRLGTQGWENPAWVLVENCCPVTVDQSRCPCKHSCQRCCLVFEERVKLVPLQAREFQARLARSLSSKQWR